MFNDRTEAGRQLAERLQAFAGQDALVIALPRGGVPVAVEVAKALEAPLDILQVRKIGAPGQPELAAAAIAEGNPPHMVRNREIITFFDVSEAYLETTAADMLAAMAGRRAEMGAGDGPVDLHGRPVILVDDGIATGATAKAAITAIRAGGAMRICLAVPVAPPETIIDMRRLVDDVVCLETPEYFRAVGAHYCNFGQVSTAEVAAILQKNRVSPSSGR
ncbi:phosphoribosyltransferase [Kordiimonas lacus]|uniref:Predicted phosphoribosyltransferase n=1 Tax=Kordiimonas lacus TaxID=637679 RepID=A0A1G6ZX29_9PROT|nr:phosphoribosyltransferase family protein [Kordiimonas lacus]SDE06923.1 Predicted phosphoribosyltransferase [Kordiimonas lacus]